MDKKIAIMQPYLFPYIGYFQLINSVDEFIIFDDVNYIKKGWINRNNFFFYNKKHLYTFPIKKVSQNKKILDIELFDGQEWKKDFLKKISENYRTSSQFSVVYPLIKDIVNNEESNLSKFILSSLKKINIYLGINTNIILSSEIDKNNELKSHDKIISICQLRLANFYINAIGGKDLYDINHFFEYGITIKFIESQNIIYEQINNKGNFEPHLSIVDLLMNVSIDKIKKELLNFKLI